MELYYPFLEKTKLFRSFYNLSDVFIYNDSLDDVVTIVVGELWQTIANKTLVVNVRTLRTFYFIS